MKPEQIQASPLGLALNRAAEATGVDFGQLVATAQKESSFNPRARAPTSSAAGLFQFIESTWLEMVRRHGAKHGLAAAATQISSENGRPVVHDPQARREILNLRFDPELAARMAGELTRENAAALQSRLGRPATARELYAAHVMGPAGAARLIEAAAQGRENAAALFPREAAANPWLFYDREGAPRSAAALMARFDLGPAAGGVAGPPAAPSEAGSGAAAAGPLGLADAPIPPELVNILFDLGRSASAAFFGDENDDTPSPEVSLLRAEAYRRANERA